MSTTNTNNTIPDNDNQINIIINYVANRMALYCLLEISVLLHVKQIIFYFYNKLCRMWNRNISK